LSNIELTGAVLGVINVYLVMRRSVWNYPFGIAMVVLYSFVFFQARLYSDALLQIYFFLIQIYGLWNWLHGRSEDGLVVVGALTTATRIGYAVATIAGAIFLGWIFSHYTDAAAPWMDAAIAATSVTAQYLLSIRKIENWVLWIGVDVVAIGLYFWRGLFPTVALYAVFLILSVLGLVNWARTLEVRTMTDGASA